MATLQGDDISPYVLFGLVMGICAPICFRNMCYCFQHRSKCHWIQALKSAMAFFMLLKSCLSAALSAPNGTSCLVTGRFADIFYQFSATIGDAIVVERIQQVISLDWQQWARIGHSLAVLVRLIAGMVDVHYANITMNPVTRSCVYVDEPILGALYTSMDAAISLYATCVTCYLLVRHMQKLEQDGLNQLRWYRYVHVVSRHTSFVALLTVVNVLSAIANGSRINNHSYTPLVNILWPIFNLLFVSLIGYDVDVSKVIRNMHAQLQDKNPSLVDQCISPCDNPLSAASPDTMT